MVAEAVLGEGEGQDGMAVGIRYLRTLRRTMVCSMLNFMSWPRAMLVVLQSLQEDATVDSLLSYASLGHLGKGCLVRDTTT